MLPWLLHNLGNRLRFAVRHPGYTVRALWREATKADERFLAALTGASVPQLRSYLSEPFADANLMRHLERSRPLVDQAQIYSAELYAKKVLLQYAIVRASRPSLVVETGVANGVSTAYLLLALKKNGIGHLHSVGLEEGSFLPPGKGIGWLVPEEFRCRWTLHRGDAAQLLPALLRELGTIDVFIHDSLHTYEHMMFEFDQACPHLRPGGFLLADDALWNAAFDDFARKAEARAWQILRGVGILCK